MIFALTQHEEQLLGYAIIAAIVFAVLRSFSEVATRQDGFWHCTVDE